MKTFQQFILEDKLLKPGMKVGLKVAGQNFIKDSIDVWMPNSKYKDIASLDNWIWDGYIYGQYIKHLNSKEIKGYGRDNASDIKDYWLQIKILTMDKVVTSMFGIMKINQLNDGNEMFFGSYGLIIARFNSVSKSTQLDIESEIF